MNLSTGQGEVAAGMGGSAALLRQRNSSTVLDAIRRSPSAIRVAEVAKATGLSRPTVETVAEGLLDQGWLRISELSDPNSAPVVGRPARLYEFNERAAHVVGVDIGAHTISTAIGDMRGHVVASSREKVTPEMTARTRLAKATRAIEQLLKSQAVDASSVLAMTVGTPGTVSPSNARVEISPGMPGWSEVDLKAALASTVPCEIDLENDANLAAVGERARGVAAGCTDVVFLLLGERLGAGIIAHDTLIRGRNGAAGELGYVPVKGLDHRDPRFGPLESQVNASALVRMGQQVARAQPESALAGLKTLTAKGITLAATKGDRAATVVVQQLADILAEGVAPTLLALNPEMLVVGGGISHAGDVLRDALIKALEDVVLYVPDVRMSALGEEAVVVGAVVQAVERVEREVLSNVLA